MIELSHSCSSVLAVAHVDYMRVLSWIHYKPVVLLRTVGHIHVEAVVDAFVVSFQICSIPLLRQKQKLKTPLQKQQSLLDNTFITILVMMIDYDLPTSCGRLIICSTTITTTTLWYKGRIRVKRWCTRHQGTCIFKVTGAGCFGKRDSGGVIHHDYLLLLVFELLLMVDSTTHQHTLKKDIKERKRENGDLCSGWEVKSWYKQNTCMHASSSTNLLR